MSVDMEKQGKQDVREVVIIGFGPAGPNCGRLLRFEPTSLLWCSRVSFRRPATSPEAS